MIIWQIDSIRVDILYGITIIDELCIILLIEMVEWLWIISDNLLFSLDDIKLQLTDIINLLMNK